MNRLVVTIHQEGLPFLPLTVQEQLLNTSPLSEDLVVCSDCGFSGGSLKTVILDFTSHEALVEFMETQANHLANAGIIGYVTIAKGTKRLRTYRKRVTGGIVEVVSYEWSSDDTGSDPANPTTAAMDSLREGVATALTLPEMTEGGPL